MDIISAAHAYQVLKKCISHDVEEFWVLGLTSGLKLIQKKMIFRGTVDSCQVHPRDIFRFACKCNASRLLLAHNHPSGDLTPSESDIQITNKLINISYLMEVPIIDHVILTTKSYRSMAEFGDCRFKYRQTPSRVGAGEYFERTIEPSLDRLGPRPYHLNSVEDDFWEVCEHLL